ncbi:MAG TPA: glycosyl transferase, partial [Dialister sp.]|nr:glycosyl transferase [Dialister sp.]
TEMTIHALDKNLLIQSIPVTYRDRPSGSVSKLNTYSDGIKVLMTIFKLYKDYKPLQFFSIVALILALISLVFFVPVVNEYFMTGLVPKLPTLIMAGFTMLGALLSLGIGLVLDTEVKNSKKNLEIQMNVIRMLLKNGENYNEN